MRDVNKFLISEYKKTLSIPKIKNKQQIVIAPIGLVGSGKSTVIRPLSQALNLVRLSTDEVRIIARDNKLDTEYDLMKVFTEILSYYLNKGYSVSIDGDVSNTRHREFLELKAIEKGLKIFYVKVAPPKKWIVGKLTNFKYKKGGLFKNTYDAMANFKNSVKQKWPLVDLDYIYKFDTSKESLNEQIKECVNLIKKETGV